jgi:hypothetical protein
MRYQIRNSAVTLDNRLLTVPSQRLTNVASEEESVVVVKIVNSNKNSAEFRYVEVVWKPEMKVWHIHDLLKEAFPDLDRGKMSLAKYSCRDCTFNGLGCHKLLGFDCLLERDTYYLFGVYDDRHKIFGDFRDWI